MNPTVLDLPRWLGGPPVCVRANLLAFESPEAIEAYQARYCPSGSLKNKYVCPWCDLWHAVFKPRKKHMIFVA